MQANLKQLRRLDTTESLLLCDSKVDSSSRRQLGTEYFGSSFSSSSRDAGWLQTFLSIVMLQVRKNITKSFTFYL